MNPAKIRNQFPMIKNNITYLDSGALVQKPESVIKAIISFYTKYSISNRTSDSKIGIYVNQIIDETRELVAKLINCEPSEVMFNSGTTDGLNYCAQLFAQLLKKNDEVLISKYNHSSHMIPWIEIAKQAGAKVIFSDNLINDINKKTKIIAYAQLNNTFNVKDNPVELYKKAKKNNAYIINDVAQAISHEEVDSSYCDALAFSSNKMFGPTGLGVLFVSKQVLSKIKVKKYGGGALDYIKKNGNWKPKDSIAMHEPGTPNIAGIFGFNEALKFFNSLNKEWIKNYLCELSEYAFDKLSSIKNLKIVSSRGDSILLLEFDKASSQDVASYLGHNGIYVRSGYFCAQYLNNMIKKPLLRVSLHIYNNANDVDKLYKALKAKEDGDYLDFI